jgi:hypothetical protein
MRGEASLVIVRDSQRRQSRRGSPMTTEALTYFPEELAVREQDGTTVTLLWTRATNAVAVQVIDHRNGESFELVLAPDDPPLDVFYHPYAYAAARGLDLVESRVREADLWTVDV